MRQRLLIVMPALVAGVPDFLIGLTQTRRGMAGTSPAMTMW
jgi:hypothetical protein